MLFIIITWYSYFFSNEEQHLLETIIKDKHLVKLKFTYSFALRKIGYFYPLLYQSWYESNWYHRSLDHIYNSSNCFWFCQRHVRYCVYTIIVLIADFIHFSFIFIFRWRFVNYYYSLRVFHVSVSWWFFTGVWVTVSLPKYPGLFSVFWPFSTMLSFGWSPLVCQLPSPPVSLVIL